MSSGHGCDEESDAPHDSRPNVYTSLVIYGSTATISAIVAIGLVIPLFLQWKSRDSHNGKRSKIKRGRSEETSYSTYNLYLVYIAVTDLFLSLTRVSWVVHKLLGICNESKMEPLYPCVYFIANFSISAIVCYQIWVLLRSTQQGKRIDPPSLTRVNLQSSMAYLLAAIVGVATYYIKSYIIRYSMFTVAVLLPSIYIVAVSGLVWYHGYLRTKRNGTTSVNDRGTRVLAVFFFRIVWIFIIFFIPGVVVGLCNRLIGGWGIPIFYIFFGLQPIATACCVLTKPDCKKYILDFVTMSYLFPDANCCGFGGKTVPDTGNTTSKTIRGFSTKSTGIRNQEKVNESATESNNPLDNSGKKPNNVSAWDVLPADQRLPSMEVANDKDNEERNEPTEDNAVVSADADPENPSSAEQHMFSMEDDTNNQDNDAVTSVGADSV